MKLLLINAIIVNEDKIFKGHLSIDQAFIKEIFQDLPKDLSEYDEIIDIKDKYLFPGIIDDQVHFREPGMTDKADIRSESTAAIAGGVTSFMEMPNTNPPVLTQEALEEKYQLARNKSLANYSFYMGTSNDNLDEVLKTNPKKVCGVKVFMGSSTGNMLVDNINTLEQIFSKCKSLIAVHCEDENIIRINTEKVKEKYGDEPPINIHPIIRNEEACYLSSSTAVNLAKKHNSRLHVLHLSTAKETKLFDNNIELKDKRITAEVCVHHLWFNDSEYDKKTTLVKWNPAIKTENDRKTLFDALLNNKIDIVATDHAPHLLEEKQNSYFKAPSGGPLVQHSLQIMLEFYHQGLISLEKIVQKMCHNPAICFRVKKRGFIRPNYYADIVVVDINKEVEVTKDSLYYKCKWSPFEGIKLHSSICQTFVNGHLVYDNGKINTQIKSMRLEFDN